MFLTYWFPLLLMWTGATAILLLHIERNWQSISVPLRAIPTRERLTYALLILLYLLVCFIPLAQYPPEFWLWLTS